MLHLGPTNSGKTHNAHQHFMSGDKGIYCAPLRMLAVEVFQKTNDNVSMHICTSVCMYVLCIYVVGMYLCMCVHMYVFMYVCMYICMYVCMYVCMYICT